MVKFQLGDIAFFQDGKFTRRFLVLNVLNDYECNVKEVNSDYIQVNSSLYLIGKIYNCMDMSDFYKIKPHKELTPTEFIKYLGDRE